MPTQPLCKLKGYLWHGFCTAAMLCQLFSDKCKVSLSVLALRIALARSVFCLEVSFFQPFEAPLLPILEKYSLTAFGTFFIAAMLC